MNAQELPQALRPILDQVAQRWGFTSFQPVLLQNVEYCDQMLQLLDADYPIADELRRETYANFIGPGPGGLRAFHWLMRHEHLDSALIRDYLGCLQVGPPRTGALSEEETVPLLELLWEHWHGELEEIVLPGVCQFLNSNGLSNRARVHAFKLTLSERGVNPEWHSRLAHWACRNNRNDSGLPLAHVELHKSGFLQCIRLGESPDQVVAEAMRQANAAPGQLKESAGQAILEILQDFAAEVESENRANALHLLRQANQSSLRRRAFQLLEQYEGEDWIHQGLRDRDAGVRSWALQRANQRRAQTSA